MDHPTFLKVLSGLMSSENEQRVNANSVYENFRENHPYDLVQYLIQGLNLDTIDNSQKLQCAVLLRNLIKPSSNNKSSTLDKFSSLVNSQIRDELFKTLIHQTDDKIRNNVCDIISQLANCSNDASQIVPKLFELISSDHSSHQRSALRILGDIIPCSDGFLQGNLSWINQHVEKCMNSGDIELRYECLGFLAHLLNQEIPAKKIVNCVPSIIATLDKAVELDHPILTDYLQYLIQLAETKADYFKNESSLFLDRLTSLAMNTSVSESNRPLALEVLLCMAECKPILVGKIPRFIERVIEVILNFMLDIKDKKYEHWLETGEEEDFYEQYIYYIGEEAMDRFAKAFHDDENNTNFLSIVFQFLKDFLDNSEWHFKFVGIMAISQIAEYFPEDKTEADLEEIMKVLVNNLQDTDWRVRFAACQAIGQISLDHQPYVQDNFHKEIIPALLTTLNDSRGRVQAHALAAFINFAEEVTKSALNPHVDYVIQHLVSRITNQTSILVREQAVSAIAVIAGVIGDDFMKYSDIMPLIMAIIENCTTKKEQTLRGKAIECISIIGISVGQGKFKDYSKASMDALIQISDQGFEDDDPVREFVQQSMTRMCRLMEENIAPYLPKLLPPLLKTLSIKDSVNPDIGSDSLEQSVFTPETYITNTSMIQDQEHALEFIMTAAEVLKDKFVDYIEPCASTVLKFLDDYLSYEVKIQSLSTMASLIEAARAISETTNDKSLVYNLLTNTAENVLRSIYEYENETEWEKDLDLIIAETKGLEECLDKAGSGILPPEMIKIFTEKIFELLQHSFKRRESGNKQMESGECDDEDDFHQLGKDIDLELDLSTSLIDILGVLMQYHKQDFFNSSIQLCTNFIQFCQHVGSGGNNGALLLASLLCSDILEYLSELSIPLWVNILLPLTFSCINYKDARVRQAANFSLGRAAQLSDFRQFANEAAKHLHNATFEFIQFKDDSSKAAADNAFSSLGDIVFNHYEVIENPVSYINGYLSYLPLKVDETEGQRVHKDLMERFQKNDSKLRDSEGTFEKRVMIIFVEIYKTLFSTEELDKSILELIKNLGYKNIEFLFPNPTKMQLRQLELLSNDILVN